MPSTKRARNEQKLDVVVVCCGEPFKSMGWFHLTQLLDHESVIVSAVVEPYFLGAGAGKPGSERFAELKDANPKIAFCASVPEVPDGEAGAPRLFLIAGRTCDAPDLFAASLDKGATHVYIEKPGADNAEQLKAMAELAARERVEVVVGYNKNVAAYVRAQ